MPSRTPTSRRPASGNGAATTNGSASGGVVHLAAADGTVMVFDDPMTKILGLDSQTSGPGAWLAYYVAAIALLIGLSAAAQGVTRLIAETDMAPPASMPQEIDVMRDEPPPPPPPPAEEPKAEPTPAQAKAAPHEAPPPAAAPAQAAKVLAQEPDPNEPVDLTGDTIVTGNADTYAGGVTASNGTSARAVRGLAAPTGTPGGTGAPRPPPPPGPDRSRRASIGATEWNMPFPPEADTAQIDDAYVTLQVDVRPDGTAEAVRVLSDPGNGFGREARKYALTQRYTPELDHDGNPVAKTVTTKVHFTR